MRHTKGRLKLLDLEKTYLQIHEDEVTDSKLRFRRSISCTIMAQDPGIEEAADSYLEDIVVGKA